MDICIRVTHAACCCCVVFGDLLVLHLGQIGTDVPLGGKFTSQCTSMPSPSWSQEDNDGLADSLADCGPDITTYDVHSL